MIIFDGHNPENDLKSLNELVDLVETDLQDKEIGIYFRYDSNVDTGFNKTISTLGLNNKLTENTDIVGLSNSKLPKFLVDFKWRPATVLSFTNNYKNNKINACYNDVDLIIFYNDKQPLNGGIDVVL